MFGGKDVENRSWTTAYRGRIAIHASGYQASEAELAEHRRYIVSRWRAEGFSAREIRGWEADIFVEPPIVGAIIGTVNLIDVVREAGMVWAAQGCWHWLLEDPQPCKPYPCLGKLRLWECPDSWVKG